MPFALHDRYDWLLAGVGGNGIACGCLTVSACQGGKLACIDSFLSFVLVVAVSLRSGGVVVMLEVVVVSVGSGGNDVECGKWRLWGV